MNAKKFFKLSKWRRTLHETCCSELTINRAPTHCFRKSSGKYDEQNDHEFHSSSEDSGEADFESLGRPKTNLQIKQRQLEKKSHIQKDKASARSSQAKSHDKSPRIKAQSARNHNSAKESGFSHEASFSEGPRQSQGSSGGGRDEDSALIRAVKLARVDDVISEIRDRPEGINYPDHHKQTAIFWAVGHGNMEVLRLLLEGQARVQGIANRYGYTPLMRALNYGNIEVCEHLLHHQSDIFAQDRFKGTCLQVAATSGEVESVTWLISKKEAKPMLTHEDDDGRTPLHCAAKAGHSSVLVLLLEAAAKPNCRDKNGRTPLLFSLARNDVDSTQQLIVYQADVNLRDESGRPMLTILVNNLIQHREQLEVLCGIATILEAQAVVDARDHKDNTALMISVRNNNALLCAVLAAYNADVLATDEQDRSVISTARKLGFHLVCSLLEEFGAVAKNRKNNSKDKALLRAAYYGNRDACKHLIDKGADVMVRTKRGQLAADIATRLGYASTLQVLRKATDEVKTRDAIVQSKGKQDGQSLQRCLHDLEDMSQWNGQIQVALRSQNIAIAVEKLELVQTKELSVKDEHTSTKLLGEFLEIRKKLIIKTSLKKLLTERIKERERLFQNFARELQPFHNTNDLDPKGLQAVLSRGIGSIRSCKMSPLELQDANSRNVDEAGAEIIEQVMLKISDMHSIYFEESSAMDVFPDPNKKLVIDELQCGKCMLHFPSEIILRDHFKYCQSKCRIDKERSLKENLVSKADSAIHRLNDSIKMYRNRIKDYDEMLDELEETKKACKKTAPQAAIPLRACAALMEIIIGMLEKRMGACSKVVQKMTEKWFPGDRRFVHCDVKSCAICLVNRATNNGVHEESGVENHAISCNECTYMLQTRLRRGEQVPCPLCKKILKSVQVAPLT